MLKKVLFLILLVMTSHAYASQNSNSSTMATIQDLIEQGHTALAITKLRQLLKQEPNHYQAWFLLGVNQAEQRQFDAAITAFRRVIALQPKLAEPHNNLAVIYNEMGDFQAAVNALEASLKLKPGYLTAQENIGDLYIKLAADAYRKVLASHDSPSLRKRYQRLLNIRTDESIESLPTDRAVSRAAVSKVIVRKAVASVAAARKIVASNNSANTPSTAVVAKSSNSAVLQALETWRLAWSNQDMTAYFAAYSDEFQFGEKYASLAKWKDYKTWAIGKRTFIKIGVENVTASMSAQDVMRLNFVQHFRSDSFNIDNNKEMLFKKTADGWKIIYEASNE